MKSFDVAPIHMQITQLMFSEFAGQPREWVLEDFKISSFNLMVGKNSHGKSRLLHVIGGLAKIISGQQKPLFPEAKYKASFNIEGFDYHYELYLNDERVISENLYRGDFLLIARDESGAGKIWAEKESRYFDFELPNELLAVVAKRDRLQAPFLEHLYLWAMSVRHYRFANTFSQEQHSSLQGLFAIPDKSDLVVEVGKIHEVYVRGYKQFSDKFDAVILHDLAELGYPCSEVGVEQLNLVEAKSTPLATLYVQETDLLTKTVQILMSQGMFRALALVIELNYLALNGSAATLLVDDVGEGLDFERSRALVALLRSKAKAANFQVLLTTNDRFVMNVIPIDEWGVITRKASKVYVINKENRPEAFEEFKFLGLSNFDFFADRLYEQPNDDI